MADILFDFPVAASRAKCFEAVATPAGLEKWWTRGSSGDTELGATWTLFFDEGFDWRAKIVACEADRAITFELTQADPDWKATQVGIALSDHPGGLTWIRFRHTGWREANEHFRISSYCWAMYLRILKHWIQRGETVPYDRRLEI